MWRRLVDGQLYLAWLWQTATVLLHKAGPETAISDLVSEEKHRGFWLLWLQGPANPANPVSIMAAQRDNSGSRQKVKEEVEYGDYGDTPGCETDFLCDSEHIFRLRQAARKIAADTGFRARPVDADAIKPART